MQAIDVTRHSRLTQQLVPPTTVLFFRLLFPVCMQKKGAHGFQYDPRILSLHKMFTDDTSIIISGSDLDNLCIKTKCVLCHMSKLLVAKKLALNLDQTSQNLLQIICHEIH
jgi:hypothetical protein